MFVQERFGLLVAMGGEVVEAHGSAGVDLRDQHIADVGDKGGAVYYRQCIFEENVTRGIGPLMTQGAIRLEHFAFDVNRTPLPLACGSNAERDPVAQIKRKVL